ncbi:putative ATPase [Bacteroidales bacterium Barb6XT]|nr:putative ATPase [Bacteroidales bacterium Barb6XT]
MTVPTFMVSAFEEKIVYLYSDYLIIIEFSTDEIGDDEKGDSNPISFEINPFEHFLEGCTSHVNSELRLLSFTKFTSYCPEESSLRTFRDEYQLLPLGRKGEGLFKYLKELSKTEEGRLVIQEVAENLSLLDWFGGIDIPSNGFSNDYTVYIKDRYIAEGLLYFDQRSTNEGFLYLLFYLTLFISKDTPRFFAIDNIESSFNPKLCTKIIRLLADLAKKHGKQVIFTTHSPFILDGLNLSDDSERLFVVRRNEEGHTKLRRIEYKPERTKKLSELWMTGAIGGLPDNF